MILNRTGRVVDSFYVLGHTWTPVFLLDGDRPVLFDAGFACLGRVYEEAIKDVLGDRSPEVLFLTHVHYDHCGSVGHLTHVFPGLKVAASAKAAAVIARPNAQVLIRKLSERVIPLVREQGVDAGALVTDPFEPFSVDTVVRDGDRIPFGKATIEVLATPGHTRDLVSYYVPERRIAVAAEAVGSRDWTGDIITEFMVDFDLYLQGLRRLASLDIAVLCQAHHFVYTNESVDEFLQRSINQAERFRTRVEDLLEAEGESVERVVARIRAEEYDWKPLPKQPESAYLLNLESRVRHLADVVERRRRTHRSRESRGLS